MYVCPTMLDFKVDRELLDSAFDGYQLRMDHVPIETLSLQDFEVHCASPSASQWSYQHVSLFSRQMHVFENPYRDTDNVHQFCWFTRDGRIAQAELDVQTARWISGPTTVYQFETVQWSRDNPGEYFPSLLFVAVDRCVAATPGGQLAVLDTSQMPWICVCSTRFDGAEHYGLLDASRTAGGRYDVVLQTIAEDPLAERVPGAGSSFVTKLHALVIRCTDGAWSTEVVGRPLCTRGNVLEAALQVEPDDNAPLLLVLSTMHLHDRQPHDSNETGNGISSESTPLYTWSQSEDQVCCTLDLKEANVTKSRIRCAFEADKIVVEKDGVALLQGDLGGSITIADSVWFIDGERLEIVVWKTSGSGSWTELVRGDGRGAYEPDPDNLQAVLARLQQATGETAAPPVDEEAAKEPYNAQQLEECDTAESDNLFLSVVRLDDGNVINTADASGRQLLFTLHRGSDTTPKFCLRHDVDGLLWQLTKESDAGSNKLAHVGTLNAFGYVLASKVKRQYVTCSRACSRMAVSETHRRLFVYESSRPVAEHAQLYNRKRKQHVDNVAVQRMFQLPDDGRIVAVHMLRLDGDLMTVATEAHFYAVHLIAAAPRQDA